MSDRIKQHMFATGNFSCAVPSESGAVDGPPVVAPQGYQQYTPSGALRVRLAQFGVRAVAPGVGPLAMYGRSQVAVAWACAALTAPTCSICVCCGRVAFLTFVCVVSTAPMPMCRWKRRLRIPTASEPG